MVDSLGHTIARFARPGAVPLGVVRPGSLAVVRPRALRVARPGTVSAALERAVVVGFVSASPVNLRHSSCTRAPRSDVSLIGPARQVQLVRRTWGRNHRLHYKCAPEPASLTSKKIQVGGGGGDEGERWLVNAGAWNPHRLNQQTFDATSPRSTVAHQCARTAVTSQERADTAKSSARHQGI